MNQFAFNLITKYEGCRLEAYLDSKGIPTIGWGHTGPEVHLGLTWTQEQADLALSIDMKKAENEAMNNVQVALSQQSMGALISLEYNAGPSKSATIYQLINRKMFLTAVDEFPKWDHAGRVELLGLKIRRYDEGLTFLKGLVR
jgi:lysozyme